MNTKKLDVTVHVQDPINNHQSNHWTPMYQNKRIQSDSVKLLHKGSHPVSAEKGFLLKLPLLDEIVHEVRKLE